jgi:lipopolysaccharide transport system permease protein
VRGTLFIVLRYRHLLIELARRELLNRHADQVLGGLWTLFHPVLLLAVYITVFTVVFPTRGPGGEGGVSHGVIFLTAGIVPWLATAEVLNRSPMVLPNDAALVRQIVFPIEILPIKALAQPAVNLLILLALVIVYAMIVRGGASPGMLVLLPVVVLLHAAVAVGLAFGLSACGPFIRDLREVTVVLSSAGLFLAPILYSQAHFEGFPLPLRAIIYANPFSHLIWCYHDAVVFGALEHPVSWIATAGFAGSALVAGCVVFRKLKPVFGDAL